MIEQCDVCRYWQKLPNDGSEPFEYGKCKRYPPILDMMAIMYEVKQWPENEKLYPSRFFGPTEEYKWPSTAGADWCGEFKKNDRA